MEAENPAEAQRPQESTTTECSPSDNNQNTNKENTAMPTTMNEDNPVMRVGAGCSKLRLDDAVVTMTRLPFGSDYVASVTRTLLGRALSLPDLPPDLRDRIVTAAQQRIQSADYLSGFVWLAFFYKIEWSLERIHQLATICAIMLALYTESTGQK